MDSISHRKINYGKIDIIYNGEYGQQHDVYLFEPPVIASPKKKYSSYSVSGRNGEIIEDISQKSNSQITCVFSMLNNAKHKLRYLKRWLKGCGELQITDSMDFYYKVLMIEFGNLEEHTTNYATISVTFTIYPYEFSMNGKHSIFLQNGIIHNPYDKAFPIYYISGEGVCTLSVNGNLVSANVGQSLIIDTFLMLAYRNNNELANTSLSGDYNDLRLLTGDNIIEISAGFNLRILTNWGFEL